MLVNRKPEYKLRRTIVLIFVDVVNFTLPSRFISSLSQFFFFEVFIFFFRPTEIFPFSFFFDGSDCSSYISLKFYSFFQLDILQLIMTLAKFRTLEREKRFQNPPKDMDSYPLLKDAVAPHVGSFNALMDGPDGGLLNLAVKDIGSKTIFDTPETSGRLGNK